MTGKSSHDHKQSPQVDADPANVHGALPKSSASSTDDVDRFGRTKPPVLKLVDIYDGEAVDPAYQAKSHAISCAIQQIGMGRYQVRSLPCLKALECAPLGSAEKRPGSVSSGGCLLWLALGGSGMPSAVFFLAKP